MALKKADLIEAVNSELNFPKKQSTEVDETLIVLIKSRLEYREEVFISNFGNFCVRAKRQRRGRNPATSENLMLLSRKVVTFKCSGVLRGMINEA